MLSAFGTGNKAVFECEQTAWKHCVGFLGICWHVVVDIESWEVIKEEDR